MDSKPSAPETMSQLSNSSGSMSQLSISSGSSPSLSFQDSDIDTSTKNNDLKVDINNKTTSSSSSCSSSDSSSSDGGSENEGFVSGEEEFETAPERPIVAEPDEDTIENAIEGEDTDAPRVDSSEFSMPKSVVTIEKVSTDDDDDVLGDSTVRVLKEDSFGAGDKGLKMIGNENSAEKLGLGGVSSEEKEVLVEMGSSTSSENVNSGEFVPEKLEVERIELKDGEAVEGQKNGVLDGEQSAVVMEAKEGSGLVEDSKVRVGGTEQVDSVTVQPVDDKLVKADGMKFTGGGDTIMNAIHADLLGSGGVAVGEVEESKECETKGMEAMVDGSVSLENGFDRVSRDADKLVDLNTEYDKYVELLANKNAETAEVEPSEQNTDVAGLGKDGDSNKGNIIVDTVTEDNCDGKTTEAYVHESEIVDLIINEEKMVTEIEPESNFHTKQNEPKVEEAADGVEVLSGDKVDGGNGDGTQVVDCAAESTETNVTQEAEHLENDPTYVHAQSEKLEGSMSGKFHSSENVEPSAVSNAEISLESEDEEQHHQDEEGEIEGSHTDEETEGMIFGSSESAKQFLEELEEGSGVGSYSGAESSRDHSQRVDGQIATDSDEEVDTDEEGEGKELFDSAALAALLKAATGADSDGGSITITSQDGSRLFSVERPAGLGSSLRSVKPAPRSVRPNLFTPSSLTTGGDSETSLSEEEKKKLEKLQQLRVKFLRLVHKLGHSPEDSIAAQVLYRLALVAGRQTGQLFSLDSAKRTALQLEEEGKDDLNFSLNILVLGKTGVGKSATINSIFGEEKALIHAFEPATTHVKEIIGTVEGVKVRVIDTPGLKSSAMEQGANRKVLSSIKKFTKKCPPDIVLYVDRLDTQTRDLNDMPLLKTISSVLGSSIWRSAIVTLTHAASAPPDGPSGSPLSYEVFIAQRSHVVQQSIGQAVGDLRLMNPSLMNPVSLVENHPSCRKNRDGQKVLPNGQSWRPQLLMLCYSMKILSEASSLSKPQDPFDHRKLFGFRVRSPPLPYLLSWLLQSRTHPKLSADEGGDNGDSDIDLADLSDSDQEEDEDEYDQLPPFKPLRKAQVAKLSKEQRKAYLEEYDYRVKLLQKKQWREELRRMREIKKKGKAAADEYSYMGEDVDQENESPAAVPVPLPDMVLPPSFDGDNPAYRYRFLEPTSQFLARPVLDTHGWDHDCGYDGVNLEQSLAIASRFPAAVTVQVTKDKKEFNIHLDSSISAKHGENGSSMAGFDIQNVGKQLAYILRGETKFKNFKRNKTAAGVSVTFLGENVATGFKLEDQIALGKRLMLVGSTGTVRSQGDSAYGANLEVRLREADFPIGQDQSSLGLSLVKWRGDLALGANFQSQFSVGRSSKIAIRAGLNNKLSGQITVRISSSDQLQLALTGILPIAMAIYKSIRPGVSENYAMY